MYETPKKSDIPSIDAGQEDESTPFKNFMNRNQQTLYISDNADRFRQIFKDKPLSYKVKFIVTNGLAKDPQNNVNNENETSSDDEKINEVLGDCLPEFYKLSETDQKRLSKIVRAKTVANFAEGTKTLICDEKKNLKVKTTACFMDKYVIKSNSLIRPIWDIVVFFLLTYTLIVLPVRVAFATSDQESNIVLDMGIDILFLIDIFIAFLSPIELKTGKEIRSFIQISRKYLKTWFLLDVLAIFPFYLMGSSELESLAVFARIPRLFKVLRLMRLIKLVRAYRLQKFYNKIAYSPRIHQGLVRIMKLFLAILCLAHFSACLWYFVGQLGEEISGSSWIEEVHVEFDELNPEKMSTMYIASLYFAVSALASVGFGDIKPHNTFEMGFSIVLMLCGATAFSYITATISSLIHSFDEKATVYRQKMSNLVNFIRNSDVSQDLSNQLMKEMSIIWQNQLHSNSDTSKLKQELTPILLEKVSLELHSKLIDDGHFFKLFEHDYSLYPFISELVSEFVPATAFDGEFIASVGEECKFWAMIKSGQVVSIPAFDNDIELMSFHSGSSIGECPIFLTQEVWPWTLRCSKDTSYYTISTAIFSSIVSHHKNVSRILIKLAAQRCQRYTKMKVTIPLKKNCKNKSNTENFHYRINNWMKEENKQIFRSVTRQNSMRQNSICTNGMRQNSVFDININDNDHEMKQYIFEIRALIHNDIDRKSAVGRWRLLRLFVTRHKKLSKMSQIADKIEKSEKTDKNDDINKLIRADTQFVAAEYQKALNMVLADVQNRSWIAW